LKLSLVTNQAVIERGIVEQSQVEMIHSKMQAVLAQESADFHSIHFCPHKPESHCNCRKPEPGLAKAALSALCIDSNKTCIIGDTYADAITGLTAGCSYAILIPSTREPGNYEDLPLDFRDKVIKCSSFVEATNSIIESLEAP
jgi:D-glycero-D-manno-heptose 1,7-bisphosphate phosphatase